VRGALDPRVCWLTGLGTPIGAGMRIQELQDGAGGLEEAEEDGREVAASGGEVVAVVRLRTKRALVSAGARFLFYPTLLYNVLRNRFEAEFRWWDRVDQVIVFLISFISSVL
jgi:atypical dual specificity phosphatase